MSGAHTPDDAAWRARAWYAVAGALAVGALLGFIVIPLVQGAAAGIGAYVAICRALGVLPGTPAHVTPLSNATAQPTTRVAWTTKTLDEVEHANRAHGAQVAQQRCVACHAPDGSSAAPTIPRMAGQSVLAIYKQLHDFRSGARVNPIMSAQVEGLDDQSIADVATYFGHLRRGDSDLQNPPFVGPEIENLVVNGSVSRGLPPCTACHGTRAGGPIEVPTLADQHVDYLEAQLQAFAKGDRHNDIYHRMRSVAERLTPKEMHELAIYYAGIR
jgi:cytochrome c553